MKRHQQRNWGSRIRSLPASNLLLSFPITPLPSPYKTYFQSFCRRKLSRDKLQVLMTTFSRSLSGFPFPPPAICFNGLPDRFACPLKERPDLYCKHGPSPASLTQRCLFSTAISDRRTRREFFAYGPAMAIGAGCVLSLPWMYPSTPYSGRLEFRSCAFAQRLYRRLLSYQDMDAFMSQPNWRSRPPKRDAGSYPRRTSLSSSLQGHGPRPSEILCQSFPFFSTGTLHSAQLKALYGGSTCLEIFSSSSFFVERTPPIPFLSFLGSSDRCSRMCFLADVVLRESLDDHGLSHPPEEFHIDRYSRRMAESRAPSACFYCTRGLIALIVSMHSIALASPVLVLLIDSMLERGVYFRQKMGIESGDESELCQPPPPRGARQSLSTSAPTPCPRLK